MAAIGAAGEQARRLQDLGEAIDDAVRALRTGDALLDGLCRRVHELWMSERGHVLEWHPTEIRAASKLVLAASGQGGRFVLPAFCAGLRALGMRAQCTPPDVLQLVKQLCELETCAQSPQGFANWLFRGAALGFDAAQDESVFELAETLVPPLDEGALWAERSRQAVDQWNALAWQAAQSLDARALAQRYRAPVEHVQQRMQRGELGLNEEDTRALREVAEDEIAWGRAEVALLLQQPSLRELLSSVHVSYRLAAVIESSPELDTRLPELLAALAGRDQTAALALEARILGAAFGRRLYGLGVDPRALLDLTARIGPELIAGLLAYLNERDEPSEAVVHALRALVQQAGLQPVLARADLVRMTPALAAGVLRAAFDARVPSAEIVQALIRMPAPSLLAALAAVPALLRVAEPVLRAFMGDRLDEIEPLLPAFIRSSPDAAQVAGAALVSTHGEGFNPGGLQAIFAACVEVGLGNDVVIAIWESRRAGSAARLCALAALEVDRRLLGVALQRRGPDVMDPPELRVALEELRWREP